MTDERRLGDLLDSALRGLGAGVRRGVREERLREAFAEVVGEQLSSMCEAVSLERGTLLIATAHSALAHQLQLDSVPLIASLNERLGATVVRRLRFRGR
jgi:predicted nucleic acid-binding Zn ribbon protein